MHAIAVSDGHTEIFENVTEINEIDPGSVGIDECDGITADVVILIPDE